MKPICRKCKGNGFTYRESPCSDEPDLAVWYAECEGCDHVVSGCATEEDAVKEFNGSSVHICQHKFDEEGKIVYPNTRVTKKVLDEAWGRLVPEIGEEQGFFRCGWCGQATDPKGVVLELVLVPDGSVEDWVNAKMVNGECCQCGDDVYRSMNPDPSEDMLRDAGLL